MNYERFFISETTCTTMDIYSYTLSVAELTRTRERDPAVPAHASGLPGVVEFALVPPSQRRGQRKPRRRCLPSGRQQPICADETIVKPPSDRDALRHP